jgi:hypothetical protein
MLISTPKKPNADSTRIGEYAAVQPLSGTTRVDETFAVNGMGRAGYVRDEKSEKSTKPSTKKSH